jgi:HlyD family secretion protein
MVLQLRRSQHPTPQSGAPSPIEPQKTEVNSSKNRLFRQQALDQSSSPEQLDLPIQIVSPQRWLAVLALGAIVTSGTIWSIFGKIPITVSGQGILVYPSQITAVQSPGTGRISKIQVKVGDQVKKGDLIAILEQSETRQQLDLARNKRAQLQNQDESAKTVQRARESLEQDAIAQQRQSIQQEIVRLQSQSPSLQNAELQSIEQERRTLQSTLATQQKQLVDYTANWKKLEELTNRGGYGQQELIRQKYELVGRIETEIQNTETQLKQLDAKEANTRQEHSQTLNRIDELQAQLSELTSKKAGQAEQDLAANINRDKEIQETDRTIAQLELQLKQSTEIRSEHDGYIQELNINAGQRIEAGTGIGIIAANRANAKLQGIAFLPVAEGKKITPRMTVQITPTTVKREEFGGIVGKVTEVSRSPITQEGAAHLVGNPSILASLMEKEGAYIAVFTELEPIAQGQFRWSSSKGPKQPITEGTTTTVSITTEEVSPISYVMPFLKSLLGQS